MKQVLMEHYRYIIYQKIEGAWYELEEQPAHTYGNKERAIHEFELLRDNNRGEYKLVEWYSRREQIL